MTKEQADKLNIGDSVEYKGEIYKICGIRTREIAAPLFSLSGVGYVSYRLCSLA